MIRGDYASVVRVTDERQGARLHGERRNLLKKYLCEASAALENAGEGILVGVAGFEPATPAM